LFEEEEVFAVDEEGSGLLPLHVLFYPI
jgi:hypothetical protein